MFRHIEKNIPNSSIKVPLYSNIEKALSLDSTVAGFQNAVNTYISGSLKTHAYVRKN